MSEIDELRQRLESLEKLVFQLNDGDTHNFAHKQLDDARFMALYSIMQELAEHAGISTQDFLKHFGTRQRWWHQYYLQKIEETNPSLAAEVDTRPPDVCDVDSDYPPIFDSPPPDKP